MITNTCKRVRIDAPDQNLTSGIGIFCCNKAPRARLSPIFYARKNGRPQTQHSLLSKSALRRIFAITNQNSSVCHRPDAPTWSSRCAVINKMARTIFAAGMFSYNLSSLGGKAPVFAHRPDAITGLRDRRFSSPQQDGGTQRPAACHARPSARALAKTHLALVPIPAPTGG